MSVKCEKCSQSEMVQDKIYRMSTALVFIGYFLIIPGILLMVGGLSCSFLGAGSGVTATATGLEKLKEETAKKLLAAGAEYGLVESFKITGSIAPTVLNQMPAAKKRDLERIINSHNARIAGRAIGTVGATACGGAFTLLTFLAGLPIFIVGFLLVLKRKVWRCPSCGYFYDRA